MEKLVQKSSTRIDKNYETFMKTNFGEKSPFKLETPKNRTIGNHFSKTRLNTPKALKSPIKTFQARKMTVTSQNTSKFNLNGNDLNLINNHINNQPLL
tara:strand:- start:46 stop:339 length:294 start_codon:yes stop_codon:yes gene_type:complete